jgi:hypothetical protein
MITRKETNRFNAYDKQGKKYTILEFTEYHQVQSFGVSSEIEGLKQFQTDNGDHVNRIKKGTYCIIGLEEIEIYSDDPNAS